MSICFGLFDVRIHHCVNFSHCVYRQKLNCGAAMSLQVLHMTCGDGTAMFQIMVSEHREKGRDAADRGPSGHMAMRQVARVALRQDSHKDVVRESLTLGRRQ
jgi:hypothetical protein